MADIRTPTDNERSTWATWVASRPPVVRAACERIVPWKLYRMRGGDLRVVVHSFDEHDDGTITMKVDVLGMFNNIAFERRVFGIEVDDLVECDLPPDGEHLGVIFTEPDDVAAAMAQLRDDTMGAWCATCDGYLEDCAGHGDEDG